MLLPLLQSLRLGDFQTRNYDVSCNCKAAGAHAAAGSLFLADLTGSITLIAQQGRRASAVAGRRHNELVPFAYTPTRFGGRQQWLRCLKCGRGCPKIYGGRYFRCRPHKPLDCCLHDRRGVYESVHFFSISALTKRSLGGEISKRCAPVRQRSQLGEGRYTPPAPSPACHTRQCGAFQNLNVPTVLVRNG